jgi:predicted MFS family arabinose efflux permease
MPERGTVTEADSAAGARERGRPASLWRNRDYTGWWVSSLVSSLGSAMSQLAYPLLMLYATGSVAYAGLVGACLNIGGLSTTLLGGALADRYSRRALIISADLVQACVVTTVVVAVLNGHVNVVHIGGVALVQGMANGISGAAMTPALKRIVREDQFAALSASRQGRDMAATLVGPPVGGALFAAARWVPFLGDAVSFAVSAIGVACIRKPLGPDPDERAAHTSTLARVLEGFAYIRSSTYMRFMIAWGALANAAFGGLVLLVIALIKERGGGPAAVGLVNMIAALGGVAGAVAAPAISRRLRGRTLVLATSWTLVGAVTAGAFVPRTWEIGVIAAFTVFLVVPRYVVLETYELRVVPDELMGRVTAALGFGARALMWTAPLTAGLFADNFGVPTALLVLAGVFAVLAVWSTFARAVRLIDE